MFPLIFLLVELTKYEDSAIGKLDVLSDKLVDVTL